MEIIIIVAVLLAVACWIYTRNAADERESAYMVDATPKSTPVVVDDVMEEPAPLAMVEAVAVTSVNAVPAKKPRKPRAPKVAAPVKQPAVKKAAPVKKAAVIKAPTPRSKKS